MSEMWRLPEVPEDEEEREDVASHYRTMALQTLSLGRKNPEGTTPARRLNISVRPPDVRQVADGPPSGNFHDWTRPAIRATSGTVVDYLEGNWRTGEVAPSNQPRILAPNHEVLAVPGGKELKEVEPAMTALDRELYNYSSEQCDVSSQGRVPVLIVKPFSADKGKAKTKTKKGERKEKQPRIRRPVLIFCHDIGQTKGKDSEGRTAPPCVSASLEELEEWGTDPARKLTQRHPINPTTICQVSGCDRDADDASEPTVAEPCQEEMIPRMEAAARRGYIACCIDARYHGGRADSPFAFKNALLRGWREGGGKSGPGPAVYCLDTVWDLVVLIDFLELRPDVDPLHIGVTGIGLGALQATALAAVDCRVAAAAPMMGLFNVGWGLENNMWQEYLGSARSTGYLELVLQAKQGQERVLSEVAAQAQKDLGAREMNAAVARELWTRLAPGMLELLDAPMALSMIAPRPVCIAHGDLDAVCPVEGLEEAVDTATKWYEAHGAGDRILLEVFENIMDRASPAMHVTVDDWLDKWLLYDGEDPTTARNRLAPPSIDDFVVNMKEVLAEVNTDTSKQIGSYDEEMARKTKIEALAKAYNVSGDWV